MTFVYASDDSDDDGMLGDEPGTKTGVNGTSKSTKAKKGAYGNEEPVHVLPPHMFEGEGRFAETVAALNPEKLEQMIVDAQKAAAELGNLTTCLCCDAQCKFNPCSDYSTAATPPTNNVCFVLQCLADTLLPYVECKLQVTSPEQRL